MEGWDKRRIRIREVEAFIRKDFRRFGPMFVLNLVLRSFIAEAYLSCFPNVPRSLLVCSCRFEEVKCVRVRH